MLFMTVVKEVVESEKTHMSGIRIVVWIREVRYHQMTDTITLQDPDNFGQKLVEIIDMFEKTAGMEPIDTGIRQEREPRFQIGNYVDVIQINQINPDPTIRAERFHLISTAEFDNYRFRPGQHSLKINFYFCNRVIHIISPPSA